MKDKASADTLNTFTYQKFRLVMALYWGVLGYLLILLVMGFGANSIYPERAFIDLLNLKQLGAFAFPCLVGYFALPRFIDHDRGAKRRAFLGGTLCFALAIFVVNTLFMMTRIYESAQVLGLTPAILSKAYFYISGALISAAIVSPLGGIFALIAQITFPHPNKIQLSTQRLERALNKGTGREPPDRPETKETFNKVSDC